MKEQIVFGRNPVLEVLKTGKVHKLFLQKGVQEGSIKKIIGKAKDQKIVIQTVNREKLEELTGTKNHQGVAAYMTDFTYQSIEDILSSAKEQGEDPFLVLADGIEDPHNLGAIIRSAHQAGAHGIIIPKRRSAQVTQTVYKTSAGAVEYLPVAQVINLSQTIEELKDKGIWIYGADMGGTPYYKSDITGAIGIVIGSEGKGIGPGIQKHLDGVLSIPMIGKLDSLNASCAASILFFEVLRQRNEAK